MLNNIILFSIKNKIVIGIMTLPLIVWGVWSEKLIADYKQNLPSPTILVKQRFISSILLCAFAVLFAHSIVPHHHHDEAIATHQNSHHDDDHDDLDDSLLGDAFSHFQHDSNGGVIYQIASPTFECSKFPIDKEAVLFTQYVIRQLFKPPIIHKEYFSFAFTPSIYSASSLFRGPPMA